MTHNKRALRASVNRSLIALYAEMRTYALDSSADGTMRDLLDAIADAYAQFAKNDTMAIRWYADMLYKAKDTIRCYNEVKLTVLGLYKDTWIIKFQLCKNEHGDKYLRLTIGYNQTAYIQQLALGE